MFLRIFLIITMTIAWSLTSQAQSKTELVDDVSISSTRAQLVGKTKPIRTAKRYSSTPKEKLDDLKRKKKLPVNFSNRRSSGNAVHPELEHQGPDPLRQTSIPKTKNLATSETLLNIEGLSSMSNPPDPSGDVSDRFYVQAVNATQVAVYDLEGNLLDQFDMNTLWTPLGSPNGGGDPIILFDESESRWLLTEFTNPANLLVAVSDTDDPLGTYTVYTFSTPGFPDYPKYAISPEAIVITSNELSGVVPASLPQYFLNKEELYAGADEVTMIRILVNGNTDTEAGFYVSTPVDWNGTALPFDSRPMTMAINDSSWDNGPPQDQVEIYTFNLDWVVPDNSTVERTSIITAPFDSFPCSDSGQGFSCVPQRGGIGLDALPELILQVPHQRNFGTHESLVFNFITDATDGNNVSGIRWVELRRTPTSGWSLYQEGTFAPEDGLDRFMGGIAIDANGSIGLAYSVTSDDSFASLRYTGRFDTDPLGMMTVPEVVIVEGTSTINSGSRFGDYTQMSVSPFGECQFWFTGEYGRQGARRTRILSFELKVDTFDIFASSILEPTTSHLLTDQEFITAEFVNRGLATLSDFDVSLEVNGVEIISERVEITLESRDRFTHTFTQPVDMSAVGDYEITARITHPLDQNPQNNSTTAIVSQLEAFDASLSAIGDDSGCMETAPYTLTITNEGGLPLTSATVDVIVNGALTDQVEYNGNLQFLESDEFNVVVMFSASGPQTVEFEINLVNGEEDRAGNNSSGELFYFLSGLGQFITVNILADNFPGESVWGIDSQGGQELIVTNLGNTPPNGLFSQQVCIGGDSCFVFRMIDLASDGICCGYGEGNIEIMNAEGEVIFSNSGEFGFELNRQFCLNCNLQVGFNLAPDDSGQGEGSILMIPEGGVGPFEYSINGGITFQDNPLFPNLGNGEYDIVVNAGDGVCTFTDTVVLGTTSTDDLANQVIVNMYPNPTKGVFDIEIANSGFTKPLLNVEILDAQGKFVYHRQLGNYDGVYLGTFSLYDFPQGIYYLRIAERNSGLMHRIVKVD